MKWKTKDGREIEISEMADSHLLNTYKMLRRKGFISPKTFRFYLTCAGPNGEMAQDAFDQELDRVLDSPVSEFIDLFEEEIRRRGLEIPKEFD